MLFLFLLGHLFLEVKHKIQLLVFNLLLELYARKLFLQASYKKQSAKSHDLSCDSVGGA
jgi:hypothetical protein